MQAILRSPISKIPYLKCVCPIGNNDSQNPYHEESDRRFITETTQEKFHRFPTDMSLGDFLRNYELAVSFLYGRSWVSQIKFVFSDILFEFRLHGLHVGNHCRDFGYLFSSSIQVHWDNKFCKWTRKLHIVRLENSLFNHRRCGMVYYLRPKGLFVRGQDLPEGIFRQSKKP